MRLECFSSVGYRLPGDVPFFVASSQLTVSGAPQSGQMDLRIRRQTPAQMKQTSDREFHLFTEEHLTMSRITSLAVVAVMAGLISPANAELVGLWRFDGNTADSSVNSSGTPNGNNGTLENGASLSSEVPPALGTGQSLSLAGADQHVLVPDSDVLDVTSALTIAAWVKTVGGVAWDGVVAKSPSDGSAANHAGNYEVRIENGSRGLNFLYQRGGVDDTDTGRLSGAVVPDGDWTHIAVTAEAGGDLKYYLNGALAETSATPLDATFGAVNSSPLYIGSRADLFTTMDGLLDDVAIFNEVLSVDQIQTISTGDFTAYGVPEPSSAVLALLGFVGLVWRRQR